MDASVALQEQLSDEQSAREAAVLQQRTLQLQLDAVQATTGRQSVELEGLSAERDALSCLRDSLSRDCDELKAQLGDMTALLDAGTDQLAALQEEAAHLDADRDALRQELQVGACA